MLRHIMTCKNLNSFKMKALSFLIFFFIASSNIVSTSKGGQSLLDRKEDLPSTNKQRKLDDQYKGGYITAIYGSIGYGAGKFSSIIPARKDISKLIAVTSDDKETNLFEEDLYLEGYGDITVKMYFKEPITTLLKFFYSEDKQVANIKYIDFSNFDSSSIEDMSYLFFGCTSLESVNFGDFDASKVTDMRYMFANCFTIKSINLSSFTFEQKKKKIQTSLE